MLQIYVNHTTDEENSSVKVMKILDEKGKELSRFNEETKSCDFSMLNIGDEICIYHHELNTITGQTIDYITKGTINDVSINEHNQMFFTYTKVA